MANQVPCMIQRRVINNRNDFYDYRLLIIVCWCSRVPDGHNSRNNILVYHIKFHDEIANQVRSCDRIKTKACVYKPRLPSWIWTYCCQDSDENNTERAWILYIILCPVEAGVWANHQGMILWLLERSMIPISIPHAFPSCLFFNWFAAIGNMLTMINRTRIDMLFAMMVFPVIKIVRFSWLLFTWRRSTNQVWSFESTLWIRK